MKKLFKIQVFLTVLGSLLLIAPDRVSAHCPLCTMAAGAAAVGASMIGVNEFVIGIFIGAFACALGLWISRLITCKKKVLPKQYELLSVLIFFSVVVPVIPFMEKYTSIYISWGGEYGSLFNRTYIFSLFLLGSLVGAIVMIMSPFISRKLTQLLNGKHFNYQSIVVTFTLLLVLGLIFQFVVVLGN